MTATRILPGVASGPVLAMAEGLSFWGGVDPGTARVIDAHHPAHGADLAGAVVLMPTSRGSCSGSGVMLDLMLNGRAPAALIFSEPEDILTLGALIGAEMFARSLSVLRVSAADFARLATQTRLRIGDDAIIGEGLHIPITDPPDHALVLTEDDRAILAGRDGEAAALALRIICAMARQQGAAALTDITRGHIDGCILAHPANLIFAEKMADLLGKAMPYLAELPEDDKTIVFHALHRFSNSANMGLHVNSPFYWAALLWNDDAKEGDPDNFQVFINTLETGGPAAVKDM